jgi:hypothetical protein
MIYWTGHVVWAGSQETQNLVGKPLGMRPLHKPRSGWENIKNDLRETYYEMEAQDHVRWKVWEAMMLKLSVLLSESFV